MTAEILTDMAGLTVAINNIGTAGPAAIQSGDI